MRIQVGENQGRLFYYRKFKTRNMSNIHLNKLQQLLLMVIVSLIVTIGCQNEYTDIVEPDKATTISADDKVAALVLKITLKDGSFDNIIDKCSEVSINYPYSIRIEDELFNISSIVDIESIKQDYFHLRDEIEIIYPITVTFSDNSELLLSNEDELEEIKEYHNSSLDDEDIECVDFVYPIELSLYNDVTQNIEVVVIDNDLEMHSVFINIEDLLIDISFPIELETLDGQRISISDNHQLEATIDNVEGGCDEDDEVDFEDDDFPYEEIISGQAYNVSLYFDTTDETSQFDAYTFTFRADYIIEASIGAETINGSWELDDMDNSTILEIEFDTDEAPLQWLNQGWKIKSINSDNIEMEAESDFDGYTKKLRLSIAKE